MLPHQSIASHTKDVITTSVNLTHLDLSHNPLSHMGCTASYPKMTYIGVAAVQCLNGVSLSTLFRGLPASAVSVDAGNNSLIGDLTDLPARPWVSLQLSGMPYSYLCRHSCRRTSDVLTFYNMLTGNPSLRAVDFAFPQSVSSLQVLDLANTNMGGYIDLTDAISLVSLNLSNSGLSCTCHDVLY